MRPIKLEMIAFGPYSGKEVIDFEQLERQHLFLVTGPTGAGKTTIFDAISYALYGETSGTDRLVKSLRCDNAPEDLLTEVTLTFELKGKIHEIHRIPNQMKKKVRGEGFTEQKPEATFIKAGAEHPITGKDNVTEAIKSLIGLEVDQFRQIMMIPQGEFRKLLMAKSDERTEILKRIFQTTLYGVLQTKFREEKKTLESDIDASLNLRLKEFQRIEVDASDAINEDLISVLNADLIHVDQVFELTKAYIERETSQKVLLEKEQVTIKKDHQKLIEEKTSALFNNEKIKSLEDNQKLLETLNERMSQVDEARVRLQQIERAQKVYPFEQSLYKRKQEKNQLLQEIEGLASALVSASVLLEKTKEAYEVTIGETYINQLNDLQKERLKLRTYVDQVTKAASLETELNQLNDALKINHSHREKLSRESNELREIEELCKQKEEKNQALAKKKEHLHALEDLNGMYREKDKKEEDLSKLIEKKDKQENKLLKDKEAYLLTKKIWHMNQAALIAKELKTGQACPVCGATDHIHLAVLPEDHVTEDALQEAENGFNKSKDVYYEIESQIKSLKTLIDQLSDQIEKRKDTFIEDGIITKGADLSETISLQEEAIRAVDNKLKQLSNELKALNYHDDRDSSIDESKERLEDALKEAEKQFSSLQLSIKEQESIKMTLVTDIPDALREVQSLNKSIQIVEVQLKEMIDKKNQSEKDYKVQNDQSIELRSKHEHAQASLMGMESLLKSEEEAFNKALQEAEFSDLAVYKTFREQLQTRSSLQEKIIAFDKKYHSVKERVDKETEVVKGLSFKEIDFFDAQLARVEKEETEIQQKINQLERRVKNNKKQLEISARITDEISDVEEKYKVMGHLSDILNGQNQKKLTFERFILATYLSDVIEVANQRLHPMTNNRYTLKISTSVMDKRSSSGLDLEVFDSYTGVDRSVKTLSGGESFKASLAMALALAEVVQAYAGGIQLDTVFIDEGFGTLDQESLDSAINCLIELQDSGRLVGIISHVQELKERIRTQLLVEMNDQGSYTRFQLD